MNLQYYVRGHILNAGIRILNIFPDSIRAKNRKFKNIHKGQRCFILGSGHSILTQDLTRIQGEIVITQNHFHSHKDISIIHPSYHVVVPKYQPKEYDRDWMEWLKSMEERLPAETTFFFGSNTKYLVDERALLRNRSYYVDTFLNPNCMSKAEIDITGWVMRVPTVITLCLTIALYMGFEKIYLLGFDLDQVCRMGERDKIRFYGESHVTKNKAEIQLEEQTGASGIDWFVWWSIWRQLNLLKEEAERRNMQIINATNGGLLNVFERQKYEDVIAKK